MHLFCSRFFDRRHLLALRTMLPCMAATHRAAPGRIGQLARSREPWRSVRSGLPLLKPHPPSFVSRCFASGGWWKDSRNHHRAFSVNRNPAVNGNGLNKTPDGIDSEEEQSGAWIILSALEKAKEAELMAIAKLAASMETTLFPAATIGEQSQTTSSIKTTDSIFVSLPDVVPRAKYSAESFEGNHFEGLYGDDIRTLLHATRRGKLIDIPTILALIEGVTVWNRKFHPNSKLVTLPPLSTDQTLTVVGDLHGSLSDLATVLEVMPGTEPNKDNLLLFNGDLADRGDHGIETICIVCALCLAYPQFVYINRGNHEDLALSIAYGLMEELRAKYGRPEVPEFLTRALDAFFRSLPLATIIEDDALIVHGGPPPPDREEKLADLLASKQHPVLGGKGFSRTIVDSVGLVAPHIREEQEIIEALLWSDPWVDETGRLLEEYHDTNTIASTYTSEFLEEEEEPLGWHSSPSRGAGYIFDVGVVRRCLQKEGLTRMVRSHEQIQNGCLKYKIPTEESMIYQRGHRPSTGNTSLDIKPHMELFTVFSASKYPYKEGFNQGAVLELKANGEHKIRRYMTEDDDPIAAGIVTTKIQTDAAGARNSDGGNSHQRFPISGGNTSITLDVIRKNLFEAISHHEGEILQSLQISSSFSGTTVAPTLSFDRVVDILIKDLNLQGESKSLMTEGAKNVLAKALGIDYTEDRIDLEPFSNFIGMISREYQTNSTNQLLQQHHSDHNHHNPNHELIDTPVGVIVSSKATAVEGIDTKKIWELLDSSKDSNTGLNEWEKLGDTINESDDQDVVLEG